jgi:hypothetical protein
MAPNLKWPVYGKHRGAGYWLRPPNLIAGRRNLRSDFSNEWRYEFLRTSSQPPPPPGCDPDPAARSRSFSWLMGRPLGTRGFRCVILGDTGEGDRSQYSLLPIIRHLRPDFMIVNGDVAYPAGTDTDYAEGFFQPYAGLGIPVWAVPGNHDYYSRNRGREFHEIFCTELRRNLWDGNGLVLKPQPGTYWELTEPRSGLVILGIDSGHKADLDGDGWRLPLVGWRLPFMRRQKPDDAQHRWLEWRLRTAQLAGAKVVVLYHIPALVREKHQSKIHLAALHRLIAQYRCVRLVVTAHEHNFQRYHPKTFARYLDHQYGVAPAHDAPTYLVSGAGGAYISATDFDESRKNGYVTESRYPTADDWRTWAPFGVRLVAMTGRDKNLLNRIAVGLVKLKRGIAEEADADRPERVSLLVLDYKPETAPTVQACFLDDLTGMYEHLPPGTPVQVHLGDPELDPSAMAYCMREPLIQL